MKNLILIGLFMIVIGCSSNNNSAESENFVDQNTSDWLIPKGEVQDGGPGKDGIPSIDNPQFISAIEASFMSDDDLVVGIVNRGIIRAYPHKILDYHEIVNDVVGNDPITISYCPLTGTAFAWSSVSNNVKSTFGVSGLIYNANLILYDRNTDSNWSQLELKCVNGDQIGDAPFLEGVVETDWKTWKMMYPDTEVMSLETGFNRTYDVYPYGPYKINNDYFVFHAFPANEAIPNKERIYAIINNDKSKVYQFEKFRDGKIVKETFNGATYLIVGNEKIINSFYLTPKEAALDFEYLGTNESGLFKDSEGNKYSILGDILSGPNVEGTLQISKGVVSYWFAIAAFYPNPEIY